MGEVFPPSFQKDLKGIYFACANCQHIVCPFPAEKITSDNFYVAIDFAENLLTADDFSWYNDNCLCAFDRDFKYIDPNPDSDCDSDPELLYFDRDSVPIEIRDFLDGQICLRFASNFFKVLSEFVGDGENFPLFPDLSDYIKKSIVDFESAAEVEDKLKVAKSALEKYNFGLVFNDEYSSWSEKVYFTWTVVNGILNNLTGKDDDSFDAD